MKRWKGNLGSDISNNLGEFFQAILPHSQILGHYLDTPYFFSV